MALRDDGDFFVNQFFREEEMARFGLLFRSSDVPFDPSIMPAGGAYFPISGQSVELLRKYMLYPQTNNFPLSGNNTSFVQLKVIKTSPANFSITGADVTLTVDALQKILNAESGSFLISGEVPLVANRRVVANTTSYPLTGFSIGLKTSKHLPVGSGSIALSGGSVELVRDLLLSTDSTTFTVNGTDVTIVNFKSYSLIPDNGSFLLSGTDINLFKSAFLQAAAGSFAIEGSIINFLRALVLPLNSGGFTLTGGDAQFKRSLHLVANTIHFPTSGQSVSLLKSLLLAAQAFAFPYSGNEVGLKASRALVPNSGMFLYNGANIPLFKDLRIAASLGTFAYAGQDVTLTYTPAASGPVLILDNGFESGDFTGWDTITTGAGIVTTPVYDGTYAAQMDHGSSGIKATLTNAVSELWLKFYWRVTRTIPTSGYFSTLAQFERADAVDICYLRAYFFTNGNVVFDWRNVAAATAHNVSIELYPDVDVWNKVEVRLKIAAGTGELECRLNDSNSSVTTGLDLGSSPISNLQFYNSNANQTARDNPRTTWFDSIKASTESFTI